MSTLRVQEAGGDPCIWSGGRNVHTHLGILEQLWEVDSFCVQHELLLVLTVGGLIQQAPSDALGRVDDSAVGQGHDEGTHVKVNFHQRELQRHLQEE